MIAFDLNKALAPFKLMDDRGALSTAYRRLHLKAGSPATVLGNAAYAKLEVYVNLDLDADCVVDTVMFLALVASLPDGDAPVFRVTEEALNWTCGSASGRMAILVETGMIDIDPFTPENVWNVENTLVRAFDAGSLSCAGAGPSARATPKTGVQAVGMFGITMEYDAAGGNLHVYSSDNVTASEYVFPCDYPTGAPQKMTFSQRVVDLLTAMMNAPPAPGGLMRQARFSLGNDAVHLWSSNFDAKTGEPSENEAGTYCLFVRPTDHLAADVAALLRKYASRTLSVPLPEGRVSTFMKRVNALSEDKREAFISILVDGGRLGLTFAETVADTTEYYLADGLDPNLHIAPIALRAGRMARALNYANAVVLDYREDNIVVMEGESGRFRYILAGSVSRTAGA